MAAARVESLAMKTFSETGSPPVGRVFASCCAVDPDRKAREAERSDELQMERGSDTADIFAIRASLPQGDLFSRSFSSEETISFSARDVDEPRDSLLAPRGSRDSLRSLLRDRPGSRLCGNQPAQVAS